MFIPILYNKWINNFYINILCSGIVTTSENIDRENEYGLTEYIVNIHVMSKTQRVSIRRHNVLENLT